MTAVYASEAAAAADSSPTLAQPPFTMQRVQAFAPASLELAEDWAGLLENIGRLIQEAKDELESVKFVSGTGTLEPFGITVAGTASSRVFDLAGVYLLETDLPPRFRRNAVFMANRVRLQDIRKFVLPESAAPVFEHTPGGPTEVLSYPAYENSAMTTSVASTSKVAAFGDPDYYVITDRIGMDIEVISQIPDGATGFPKGQRGIYMVQMRQLTGERLSWTGSRPDS